MFEEQYLAVVRRVEEYWLQKLRESNRFDLTDLVAIFTRRDNGPWLTVFNVEETVDLVDSFEVLSLKQLLEDKRDLSVEYDSMVIAFEALGLVRPDIVTRGPRFYPIEQLYRRLKQAGKLSQTQQNLASTLFCTLHERGELEEYSPEYSATAWLKKASKLFRLSLPALLERYPMEGLLAIEPDENFKNYLERQQCSLIYTTVDGITSQGTNLVDLEEFAFVNVTTNRQLCAAFSEVKLFNQGVDPRTAGFVDLRKELWRFAYSADTKYIIKSTSAIRATIQQLALLCHKHGLIESGFAQPALSLTVEHELADQELDDIVAIELSPNSKMPTSTSLVCYYLTLPESEEAPNGTASLNDLLTEKIHVAPGRCVASLRSLHALFHTHDDAWLPLSDTLLKLDRPQSLARSAYLSSRLLSKRHNSPIDKEQITDEAAVACHVYGLAEPYYYYWPRGDHDHQMLQSYKNFHEQFGELIDKTDDSKGKRYYHALRIWWDYQEHDFEQRKQLLEEAVKELQSILPAEGSEDAQQYPAVSELYQLFSAMLRMFSRTWQPDRLRERLRKAGYSQIVSDNGINHWDVLYLQPDPKQPSPLFLEKLREFINLCEESYAIRMKEPDPYSKARQLVEIGMKLGQQIGLNFEKYTSKYRKSQEELQAGREEEMVYTTGTIPYKAEIDLSVELDDPFLLAEHERLWMRSIYYSAIDAHAALIYTLKSRPVHGKVTPTHVTQFESTGIKIWLTGKTGEELEKGLDVEVILSISTDYDIQSRYVRKRFGVSQPVEFTVAFRTKGDVALLFEYIIDKKKHYQDEAWVHVVELETQERRVNNPYQYGDVILSPENHYGRREELKQVFDKLCDMVEGRERQNFRLHGMRRSGKTSLLNMIRKSIEEPETRRYFQIPEEKDSILDKWHPVFYSLQELPRDVESREHLDSRVFFKSLTEDICESLHWTKKTTRTLLERIDADFARSQNIVAAVKTELEQILKRLPVDERILILLDEVDLISITRDDRFFGQLRSIILSPELRRIAWVLTSVRVLQAAQEGVESPLHNIFASITLKNLDATEARRLILERARRENIYFAPEATESILQQTGRQPYFLQVVCSTIVDQLNNKEISYVSKLLVDAVVEQLLEPGTVIYEQCRFLWDWAAVGQKVILVLLARHKQGMAKADLIEEFRDAVSLQANEELNDANTLFDDAWNELFANDLVSQDQDDQCRLTIPIFRRWLAKRNADPHNPR